MSAKKSPAQVKKDLEVFEKGIIRLKELERELKNLDTRGFSAEEQSIRSKLKNVSDIPLIEKEIKALRLKINNKYKPRKVRKSPYKKIERDLEDVKGELHKMSKKKALKVDVGVGSLVDSDFDDFLKDIKLTLSERIRSREKDIKNILKSDLRKRDVKFSKEHKVLIDEFKEKERRLRNDFESKYKKRVESSLKKEVEQRFNRELNEKLKINKESLAKKYQAHLNACVAEHLKRDKERLRKKLLKELRKKIVSLHKDFDRKRNVVEKGLRKKYSKRLKSFEKRKKNLDVKVKEVSRLSDFNRKAKRHNDELIRETKRHNDELASEIKKHNDELLKEKLRFERSKKAFQVRKKKEREAIKKSLTERISRELEKKLVDKEKKIRSQMRSEYSLMLSKKLQERDEELKKKKLVLGMELQRKMREALK